MNTKPVLTSKIVWLGILMTLAGVIPVVVELLNKSAITPADCVLAFGGVLTVVLRIWFTDTKLQ
jgi:hypothetical protein